MFNTNHIHAMTCWLLAIGLLFSAMPALASTVFTWRCADGSFSSEYVANPCTPPEFVGQFWLSCLPGHDDCTTSDTAFLGFDPQPLHGQLRGHGICYTSQPYTCWPTGKMP